MTQIQTRFLTRRSQALITATLCGLLVACGGPAPSPNAGGEGSDPTSTATDGAFQPTNGSSTAPAAAVTNPADGWEISTAGIGPIQAGMTLGQVKQTLGAGYQFQDIPNFMVDFGAIAVSRGGEPDLYLVYFSAEPIRDRDRVPFLMTDQPRHRTAAGVHAGMTIAEAAQRYGRARLNYNMDNEGREYVQFENAPIDLSFRTDGAPGNYAGIYGPEQTGEGNTNRYRPDATIQFIWVDAYRRTLGSGVPTQVPQASVPSAAYQAADRALNETYQRVMGALGGDRPAELRTAQRAWIVLRDRQCDLTAAALGDREGCLTDLTRQRTAELETFLTSDPGEAIAPTPRLGTVTLSGHPINCDNPQNTPEINGCAAYAADRDADRTAALVQEMRSQRPQLQSALDDADRAWQAFRDAHCEMATAPNRGGTGFLAFLSSCQGAIARQQHQAIAALKP
ncbi:MAG: hypothetical protein Fur0042_16690 [Cyanophyceae cyanobacterium]